MSAFFTTVVAAQLGSFSATFCPAVSTAYKCVDIPAQPATDVSAVNHSFQDTHSTPFIAAVSRSIPAAYVASQLSAFGGPEQPTECTFQHPAQRSAVKPSFHSANDVAVGAALLRSFWPAVGVSIGSA